MLEVFKNALTAPAEAPAIFSLEAADWAEFQTLCAQYRLVVQDSLDRQLGEWARTHYPAAGDEAGRRTLIAAELDGRDPVTYGQWVYYPWRATVTHLLPAKRYRVVRSDRNRDKISAAEQAQLAGRRIGVVGLSVGHASALVLAQEGLCGELRIADFDTIDLSNLNRLRTSVTHLGLAKTTVTARELAELDPYLKVAVYPDGITEDNLDEFLTGGGALDLVVEECDNFPLKLLLRERARAHGIPVIMDTNDRGLLDIERYDRQPDYPLLHGLLAGQTYESMQATPPAERVALLNAFLGGIDQASPALRDALGRIGTSLVSYPQLATDVHLGAALLAHAARRILLGKLNGSGRYYIDLEQLIQDRSTARPGSRPLSSAAP